MTHPCHPKTTKSSQQLSSTSDSWERLHPIRKPLPRSNTNAVQSRQSQQPKSSVQQTLKPVTHSVSYPPKHALNPKIHDNWDTTSTATTTTTPTTCESSASSFCEISFKPKAKDQWYGEPLVRVRRFEEELHQLRNENVILRHQCRVLQQQHYSTG